MSLAEVVVNVQPADDSGEPFTWLVHARELRDHIDQSLRAIVAALERGLSHRVLERTGGNRVTLVVIRIQQALRGGPLDHLSELPSQIHRVLHAETETLSADRVM